ncbi:MAG: Ig-like domain-containing protein [Longimicrobiales bacterium]
MKRTTLLLLGSFFVVTACDSTDPDPVDVVNVTPPSIVLRVGDTDQLEATATTVSGNAVDPARIEWESTNSGVATVDATGLVTGVADGEAEIIASVSGVADSTHVSVGPFLTFNVNPIQACSAPEIRSARIVAETQHAIIVADVQNPDQGFTEADFQEIAQEFETNVYPTVTTNFGVPTDIDGNGKIYIFYTGRVNELTDEGEGSFIGGFFFARDLFPVVENPDFAACETSNEAEIFYMLVPDPTGEINNNVREKEFVRRVTIGTLAHEFEHLINAGRRLYVNNAVDNEGNWAEETWLDEGLAHIAEELVFYADAGMAPEQNITGSDDPDGGEMIDTNAEIEAFNEFQLSNFLRFHDYLPDTEQATFFDSQDDLATRGASWSFLRYAADRAAAPPQSSVWHQLVRDATETGFENLDGPFGAGVATWMTDWAIAHYADDLVLPDPIYRHLSWDFRYILGVAITDGNDNPIGFPLGTRDLAQNDTVRVSLGGGSAAYIEFGVPAGTQAEVKVEAGGATSGSSCLSGGPTISLAVGEVHRTSFGNAGHLCLAQQPATADYTLIPVLQVTSPSSSLALEVTGTNVTAPGASANLLPSFDRRGVARPIAEIRRLRPDTDFETALRRRERVELSALVRGAAPRFSFGQPTLQVAPATDLQLAIVRVR